MASSPFGLGIANLLLVLIPGYIGLKGYLSARVTIDNLSRIDKLLLTIGTGVATGIAFLWLLRLAALLGIIDSVGELTLQEISTVSIYDLSQVLVWQSLVGVFGGYLVGTVFYVQTGESRSIDKNLKQPWKTAVRRATIGDEIEVVTRNNELIVGKLHRIGSPSKDNDILLESARKIVESDNGDREEEPIGYSYHHYRDISQVHFPKIEPNEPTQEHNYIIRCCEWGKSFKRRLQQHRYGYTDPEDQVCDARQNAVRLQQKLDQEK